MYCVRNKPRGCAKNTRQVYLDDTRCAVLVILRITSYSSYQRLTLFIPSQVLSCSKEWKSLSKSSTTDLLKQCLQSRAFTTIKKYMRSTFVPSIFKEKKHARSIPSFARACGGVFIFFSRKKKVNVVSNAYYALKWIHGLLPISANLSKVGLCKNLLETERRKNLLHPTLLERL